MRFRGFDGVDMNPLKSVHLVGKVTIVSSTAGLATAVSFLLEYLRELESGKDRLTSLGFGIVLIVLAGLSIWGLVTGAGLLRFKRWARKSALVLGVLNILFIFPTIEMGRYALWERSGAGRGLGDWLFAGVAALLLLVEGVGVWSLFLLNGQTVKERFRAAPSPVESGAAPISVLVIGCWLIFGALFSLSGLLTRESNTLALTFSPKSWTGIAWCAISILLSLGLGIELLRSRKWAAFGAITYLLLELIHFYWCQIHGVVADNSSLSSSQTVPRIPWVTLGSLTLIVGTAVYFLLTRKKVLSTR
jgi:hypothetical protein